jgi:biopolymer transport protein ExbD
MCLIIFFLIVGKLAGERGPMVPLPQSAVGQQEQSPVVMIVTVARSMDPAAKAGWGAYGVTVHLDGQPVDTPKDLESAVRGKLAGDAAASVQIRADRDLPFGAIDPVLQAAGRGGAKSVRMAAERVP